ncbi:hypothetical protein FE697_014835 [Mumia zhuanghuii]|uniref:Uncharacterized protein n=2 Tax=Mumia TaxID=1546255 RepID=A0ABW1QQZ9_9ACTN|nr:MULTISPECIES: hypothetical protein [Mumia]KAA1422421.1 hypothetical protein FE697_014835 [Mumia zhuanghuii]
MRWIGAAVVVGLAFGAAMFGVQEYESRHADIEAPLPPGGDRVAAATDALVADHLYVAPELQRLITPEEQARVATAAAAADPAAFIALSGKGDAGYYLDADLAQYLIDGVGEAGSYLVWDGESVSGTERTTGGDLSTYVSPDMAGKTEAALMRYIDAVDAATLEPLDDSDYWGGPRGGFLAALLMVSGGYLALTLVVGVVRVLSGASYFLPGRWRDFVTGSKA